MFLNLTQHAATPEQKAHGVVDLSPEGRALVAKILTFDTLPSPEWIETRAWSLAGIAKGDSMITDFGPDEVKTAMIGGAPWLMGPLSRVLREVGITPVFAFSKRVSEETVQEDGTVLKTNEFRHEGFVEA